MSTTRLEELPANHPEYQYVDQKMHQTIRDAKIDQYRVLKIEKIENKGHWRRYSAKLQQLGEGRMLFHGTDQVEEVLEHGLEMSRASRLGLFGQGES